MKHITWNSAQIWVIKMVKNSVATLLLRKSTRFHDKKH